MEVGNHPFKENSIIRDVGHIKTQTNQAHPSNAIDVVLIKYKGGQTCQYTTRDDDEMDHFKGFEVVFDQDQN